MSGHSKWAKIKRQKGANDLKKGMIFTKLARNITLAAKEGGGDPVMNFALRLAVDKAKAVNMPSDNIERSIKKGVGGNEKNVYQRISYEAISTRGASLIIDCQTDNTNRTVSDIKKILEMGGAKLASVGSVAWQFTEHGLIVVRPARLEKAKKYGAVDVYVDIPVDEVELMLLEIPGIEDIEEGSYEDDDGKKYKVLDVLTSKNDFSKVLKKIEELDIKIISFEIIKQASEYIALQGDDLVKYTRLVSNLDEHDDVDAVWSNVKGD